MLLDTPVCDYDWQAPDFTLNDFNGHSHTLSESYGPNGLLLAFICNHCPYVQAIGERLATDSRILIEEGRFPFPYLVDETQSVGKTYGAVCTPDFFGFNRKGGLQYRGRVDDAGRDSNAARSTELLDAMRLIAKTNHGPVAQTPSMRCSIKWRQ